MDPSTETSCAAGSASSATPGPWSGPRGPPAAFRWPWRARRSRRWTWHTSWPSWRGSGVSRAGILRHAGRSPGGIRRRRVST
ncbi:unnamed protein product [Ectocarpus sp. 4 AP-2014]